MTRKHFEWAAELIRTRRASGHWTEDELAAMENVCTCVFSTFNDRFNHERFVAACQPRTEG